MIEIVGSVVKSVGKLVKGWFALVGTLVKLTTERVSAHRLPRCTP